MKKLIMIGFVLATLIVAGCTDDTTVGVRDGWPYEHMNTIQNVNSVNIRVVPLCEDRRVCYFAPGGGLWCSEDLMLVTKYCGCAP